MLNGDIDTVQIEGEIVSAVTIDGDLLPIGPKGDKGDPGFSPTVTTSKSGKTTTVTFGTATGNVYAYIQDGEDGQGSGDMMTDVYDQNKNGIVDNAEKVNGKTVETNVPASAIFTDENAVWGNITGTLSNQADLSTALGNKVNTSSIGVASGIAELDENGKVPSSQLPSYVDDVIEGYYYNSKFYQDLSHTIEITGETGKIYVDLVSNKTYRWGGTEYAEISSSLALGETNSTAYRGDRGKTAYDHSQTTSGNPHNVTKTDVGLGNVGNFKAVSTEANQNLSSTEKNNARTNIGAGTSSFSGSYTDLSNKPTNVSTFTNDANYVTSNGNAETTQTNVSSATFTNTLEAPMNIDLKGNTLQNGTPTPSSPIPVNNVSGDNDINIIGKNILNISNIATTTRSGISITNNGNGTITLNGTASSPMTYDTNLPTPLTLKAGTTYHLDIQNLLNEDIFTFALKDSANNSVIFNNSNLQNTEITPEVDTIITYIRIYVQNGKTLTNYTIKPILYNEVQTYPINLPVENLFDKDNAGTGYRIGGDGGNYVDANYFTSEYIKVAPNTTYTIKKDSVGQYNAVALYTQNKGFISRSEFYTTTTYTFTTNANTYYIRVCDTNDNINSLKVGNGTEITNYSIELNKIGTYQDYFYKENDKWYLHKEIGKVVLNGSEITGKNAEGFTIDATAWNNLTNNNCKNSSLLFTDYYKNYTTYATLIAQDYGIGIIYNNVKNVYIRNTSISTKSDFETWLSTHNTSVYYQLSTPTNTEITYTPLIEQLESIKNAMSKEGTTNVNQVNNDLPFMLDLSVFNDNYNGRYEALDYRQTKSEDRIENLESERPVVLYDNSSGTNADITLSDDCNNYSYIEIFYGGGDEDIKSTKTLPEKNILLFTIDARNSVGQLLLISSLKKVSGTSITNTTYANAVNYGLMTLSQSGNTFYSNNAIKIYRVLGYK